jgi:hypothetical protein
MAAAGAPPDVIERTLARESEAENDLLEIWPEHWNTVTVFLALSTQWKREIPAMSGTMIWRGMDYAAIEPVIRLMGFWSERAEIFGGLQIMEKAAINVLNKG